MERIKFPKTYLGSKAQTLRPFFRFCIFRRLGYFLHRPPSHPHPPPPPKKKIPKRVFFSETLNPNNSYTISKKEDDNQFADLWHSSKEQILGSCQSRAVLPFTQLELNVVVKYIMISDKEQFQINFWKVFQASRKWNWSHRL